jgi:hypothetical protein
VVASQSEVPTANITHLFIFRIWSVLVFVSKQIAITRIAGVVVVLSENIVRLVSAKLKSAYGIVTLSGLE